MYRNIEEQAKVMETTYNVPKFVFMEEANLLVNSRGKDRKISLRFGFSRILNAQIELIEWRAGDCIYKEFLDKGKEGLHHFSAFVDNLQACVDEFQKKGFEVIHAGIIGRQRYVYFDTKESFGLLLEFQETVKKIKKK